MDDLRSRLSTAGQLLRRGTQVVALEARAHRAARGAKIGRRCLIEGRPFVNPEHITLGDRVIVRRRAELLAKAGQPIVLGDEVGINQGVIVRPGVTLGDRVSVGSNAMLLTDSHEIGSAYRRAGRNVSAPITIGDGAWIGAGATVLPGVTIGAGAVIAAGAVVARDCVAHGVYAGVPARLQRMLDADGADRDRPVIELGASRLPRPIVPASRGAAVADPARNGPEATDRPERSAHAA